MNISPTAKIYSALSARAATGQTRDTNIPVTSGAGNSDTVSISDTASGMSNLRNKLNL